MKKRFLSLALALALCLGLSTAGASAAGFTRSRTYSGQFADVPANTWYSQAVKDCYELGLINGTSDTTFSPAGLFTLAEASSIAARMHSIYHGGSGVIPSFGGEWYQGAVDYCIQNGIYGRNDFSDYTRPATRAQMAGIIAAALPDSAWTAKNHVTALPDVSGGAKYSDAIFALYDAGVFAGSDEYGAFQPYAYITRAEVAAIVARCADPGQRVTLNLTPMSQRALIEIPDFHYTDVNGTRNSSMSDGLIRVQDPDSKLYGFVNWKGEFVYPYIFSDASNFNNGYAWAEAVKIDNGRRLKTASVINAQGDLDAAIPLVNEYISSTSKITYSKTEELGDGVYAAYYTLHEEPNRYGSYQKKTEFCALVVNGRFIGDQFSSAHCNGEFVAANYPNGSSEVYNLSGNIVNWFKRSIGIGIYTKWSSGSPLVAIKGDNKWALGTLEGGVITPEIYDEIRLYEDSSLALLKIGNMYGLAGPNGVILDIGEYEYVFRPVVGNYALVKKDGKYLLANLTGILPGVELESINGNGIVRCLWDSGTQDYVVLRYGAFKQGDTYPYAYYDVSSAKLYRPLYSENSNLYYTTKTSGFTADGIPFSAAEEFRVYSTAYYAFKDLSGKWGLLAGGSTVVEAAYDTAEEALAAYGFYQVEYNYNNTGKPAVVYGNAVTGFTPVIQRYQNSLFFDQILDIGEGYYACRYDTTWYLVHP